MFSFWFPSEWPDKPTTPDDILCNLSLSLVLSHLDSLFSSLLRVRATATAATFYCNICNPFFTLPRRNILSCVLTKPTTISFSLLCGIAFLGSHRSMGLEDAGTIVFSYPTIVGELPVEQFTTKCLVVYFVLDPVLWFGLSILTTEDEIVTHCKQMI
jgi:hypothetical protein